MGLSQSVTKPRRRTVAAVIAAALAISAGAAYALVLRPADGEPSKVTADGAVGAVATTTTSTVEDTPLVSLVPVPPGPGTTVAPAAARRSTGQAAGTKSAVPTCSTRQVGLSVVTDRGSYRPGDTVVVTAVIKNASALDCSAPLMAADGACQPQVVLASPFVTGSAQVRLGPFSGTCSAPPLRVPARSTVTAIIQAPFQLATGAGSSYLPAGGWKVQLTWPGLGGTISAQTALRCELPDCGPRAAATTVPTLPPPP